MGGMLKRFGWVWVLIAGGLVAGLPARASEMEDLVESVGLAELAATFDEAKVDRILGDHGTAIEDPAERAAAATLVTMNMVHDWALDEPEVAAKMLTGWAHPDGETEGIIEMPLVRPSGIMRVKSIGGHDALRRDEALMAALDEAIGAEVLTGYGLRPLNVSAATAVERTVIYSHSSVAHVKQLIGLMASEGLKGRVMIAPKVAAFVFREGWGERPEWLNELGEGIYVAQGPEMLMHFELASPDDRQKFDQLVERYAKKDEADETGNLVRSWWQPFYYTETEAVGFSPISQVTLYGDEVEASLLMLPTREKIVRNYFANKQWEMKIDTIWVNAPFRRFLEGDYK
jgi:hypothetical protein